MRALIRKIGNSRGVLIPAALLESCGIKGEVDMRLEGNKIIIEPLLAPREGWFDSFDPAEEVFDEWDELPEPDGDWAW